VRGNLAAHDYQPGGDPDSRAEFFSLVQLRHPIDQRVTEIVENFGGFIARYMGDGVLVYFGYPQAHEDDAERATR
jgi:class 3 adenylate cyclase